MDIGTAHFKLFTPGEPPREYTLVCSEPCAYHTFARLRNTLPSGIIVELQWYNAAGHCNSNIAAGRHAHHVRIDVQQLHRNVPNDALPWKQLFKPSQTTLVLHSET